jgi:hypothetical protein
VQIQGAEYDAGVTPAASTAAKPALREPRAKTPAASPPAATPQTAPVQFSTPPANTGAAWSPPPIRFYATASVGAAEPPARRGRTPFSWRHLMNPDVMLPAIAALIVLVVLLAWAA